MQKFLCISAENEKLDFFISMLTQKWHMRSMKGVEEDILLTFNGTTDESRTFLSALGQL